MFFYARLNACMYMYLCKYESNRRIVYVYYAFDHILKFECFNDLMIRFFKRKLGLKLFSSSVKSIIYLGCTFFLIIMILLFIMNILPQFELDFKILIMDYNLWL